MHANGVSYERMYSTGSGTYANVSTVSTLGAVGNYSVRDGTGHQINFQNLVSELRTQNSELRTQNNITINMTRDQIRGAEILVGPLYLLMDRFLNGKVNCAPERHSK